MFPRKETLVDSESPKGKWIVFFEDDAETAYFYALDAKEKEAGRNPILEAMHIYNVKNVTDKDKESVVSIVWSSDGQKACLLINKYPHAVFDFENKRGYCRTNFPEPGKWKPDFKWDDKILETFKQ
ncbi:MAG: DUF2251 domain-containing protein [Blastochloris sp.]|nr:DUF2251 domain-containing protein [Blastochloris sp.]